MASYTAWDINDYLPGQPLTSAKVISFHENLDAVCEGASGALRIRPAAMSDSVAGDTLLFGTGGTGQVFTSGDDALILVYAAQFRATTSCEVRVQGQFRRSGGNSSAIVSFYVKKNGTNVLSETSGLATYQTSASVDISLVAGDLVLVAGEGGTDGAGNDSAVQIRDITYSVGSVRTVGGI